VLGRFGLRAGHWLSPNESPSTPNAKPDLWRRFLNFIASNCHRLLLYKNWYTTAHHEPCCRPSSNTLTHPYTPRTPNEPFRSRPLPSNMSDAAGTFKELADVPKEFIRDGTLFINRCTKRKMTSSCTPSAHRTHYQKTVSQAAWFLRQ
jgi:hypothetical protein